jgi:hypothetical protein
MLTHNDHTHTHTHARSVAARMEEGAVCGGSTAHTVWMGCQPCLVLHSAREGAVKKPPLSNPHQWYLCTTGVRVQLIYCVVEVLFFRCFHVVVYLLPTYTT